MPTPIKHPRSELSEAPSAEVCRNRVHGKHSNPRTTDALPAVPTSNGDGYIWRQAVDVDTTQWVPHRATQLVVAAELLESAVDVVVRVQAVVVVHKAYFAPVATVCASFAYPPCIP